MSEHHHENSKPKSLMEKIADKIHGLDDSSSSPSDNEKSSSSIKSKIYRIFGREKPLHKRPIFLWKNKNVSGGATATWVLFELLEYRLFTLVCHCSMLALALLFLWSNTSTFINKSPPRIPEVRIPKDLVLDIANALTVEINRGLAVLHEIASGQELKKFLTVIAGLWVLSIMGNWCNSMTLFYIAVVLLFTIPMVYDKYEDKIDPLAEKDMVEIKQYAVFDAKVSLARFQGQSRIRRVRE